MTDDIKKLALTIAEIADNKKAQDIQVLEVKGLTIIADYFVICSGKSEIQTRAIAGEIQEELTKKGVKAKKIAGSDDGRWILIDYADVIVHIFHERERDYYELERLWADAEKILKES